MAPRFLTILTGRNLPKIRQPREPERSIINEKTIADFARVVEQTGILKGATEPPAAVGTGLEIRIAASPSIRRCGSPSGFSST
jgi:hypothetical protein